MELSGTTISKVSITTSVVAGYKTLDSGWVKLFYSQLTQAAHAPVVVMTKWRWFKHTSSKSPEISLPLTSLGL